MISGKARAHRTSAQVVACSFKMVRVTGSGKFTKAVSKKLHVEDAEDKDEADSDKEEETVKEVVKDDEQENADGSDDEEEAGGSDDDEDDEDVELEDEDEDDGLGGSDNDEERGGGGGREDGQIAQAQRVHRRCRRGEFPAPSRRASSHSPPFNSNGV